MSNNKIINNPFDKIDGYNCFGCSENNLYGLKMKFYEDGEFLISKWKPNKNYCGYNDLLHGGIQATLCDELASWTVYVKKERSGVTSRLNMKYRNPVNISNGELTLKSRITGYIRSTFVIIEIKLYDGLNKLCSEGEAIFRMFSKEESIQNYGFPKEGMDKYK
ncbi:MAG: PaaI family thioesterase [Bacteroidales bacterium]